MCLQYTPMAAKWEAAGAKPKPFPFGQKMVSGNLMGGGASGAFGFGRWRRLKDVTTGWWGEDANGSKMLDKQTTSGLSGGGRGGGGGGPSLRAESSTLQVWMGWRIFKGNSYPGRTYRPLAVYRCCVPLPVWAAAAVNVKRPCP